MKRWMATGTAVFLALAGIMEDARAEKAGAPRKQNESTSETVVKELAVDTGKESIGVIGEGLKRRGGEMTSDAFRSGHGPAFGSEDARRLADEGLRTTRIGEIVDKGGTAISHAEWVSSAAGRAYEEDYAGAAIEGVNGFSRTVATGAAGKAAGQAAGIWIAAKVGAQFGAIGGPVGLVGGFVIGVGVGYLGGKLWDYTIGSGAKALDQKVADWQARRQYLGTGSRGGGQSSGGGGGARVGTGLPHPDGGGGGAPAGSGQLRKFR